MMNHVVINKPRRYTNCTRHYTTGYKLYYDDDIQYNTVVVVHDGEQDLYYIPVHHPIRVNVQGLWKILNVGAFMHPTNVGTHDSEKEAKLNAEVAGRRKSAMRHDRNSVAHKSELGYENTAGPLVGR